MKITSVEAIPIYIEKNKRHLYSSIHEGIGMLTGIGYVIVKIHTDEGITGIGEVGRFFLGETQESIVVTIRKVFGPAIIGADPLNISMIHRLMENQMNEIHWAKSAIDLAIYDLIGKYTNLSVSTIMGGRHRDRIPVCPTLYIKESIEETVEDALYYVDKGFKSLKVKVGDDAKTDIELIKSVRKAVGDDIGIRIDANQAYSVDMAVRTLRRMEEYNLMLIEQPCPRWDVRGMKRVRDSLDTPIITCESVCTPQDAINFVYNDALDGINLKLGRPGGIYGSLKVAAIAEGASIPVAIGTMMELGIGTAAALHFAAILRHLPYPSDTYGPLHLEDDILTEPLKYEDGCLIVPDGPGFGVEIDEEKLAKYHVDWDK